MLDRVVLAVFLLLACGVQGEKTDFPDLEDCSDEFVLEMRKIEIPCFPYAFNPSIVPYKNHFLMSFRLGSYMQGPSGAEEGILGHIPENRVTSQIGLILLDRDFQIISDPQVLQIPYSDENIRFLPQDPRLVNVGGRIYIAYNNFVLFDSVVIQRMHFSPLSFNGYQFVLDAPECITQYDKANPVRTEKNWSPFDYLGNLCFEYSFLPHKVLQPICGTHSCDLVGLTKGNIQWEWGHIRGGTAAIRFGDQYLGFFHSSTSLKTAHSKGKKIPHYFMGAYTFSANPPFPITSISPKPIIAKGFYSGQNYVTWKPLFVVFPGGYVFDEEHIWLAYGRQDHEIWIAKLDKKRLLNSLVPVESQSVE